MRRFIIAAVFLFATTACTVSPTAAKRQADTPTRPSHTSVADSAQAAADERNGNTMGSGH